MQECKRCKATWNIEKQLEVCPFCGNSLFKKKQIESIEEVFEFIVEQYGRNIFVKGRQFIGLISDYAPNLSKELKLVKIAIEVGAYEAILNAANISNVEIEYTIKKYVALLNDVYFIDELWAKKALMWCADVVKDQINETSINLDDKQNDTVRVENVKNNLEIREVEPIINNIFDGMTVYENELVKYTGNSTNVIVPNGIRLIRSHAFYSNARIQKVTIPNTVKILGKSSFAYCFNLQQVEIQEGLEEIGDWAFVNCKQLSQINLPQSLSKLGELAFQGCESLQSIVIPPQIKEIKEYSFHECRNLNNIKIPKETVVDKKAFDSWHKPQLLCSENQNEQSPGKGWSIKDNNTMIVYTMAQEFETYDQKNERKRRLNAVTKVIISEGISEIKTEYFRNMKNLREVVFPVTLKKIGFASFYGCEELRNVEIPDGVETISARAFENCVNLEKVRIPLSVKYIGDNAFLTNKYYWESKLRDVYVNKDCAICGGNKHIKNIPV